MVQPFWLVYENGTYLSTLEEDPSTRKQRRELRSNATNLKTFQFDSNR